MVEQHPPRGYEVKFPTDTQDVEVEPLIHSFVHLLVGQTIEADLTRQGKVSLGRALHTKEKNNNVRYLVPIILSVVRQ